MNKLSDNKLVNSFTEALNSHGSTLAMIGGFVSFGFMLWSAFKASKDVVKASETFRDEKEKLETEILEPEEKKQKVKELRTSRNVRYVLAYRWVALFGLTGSGLMILTKIIDGKAIASWMALAATQRDKLEKLSENAKKMIGEEKFKEIEDKTLDERMLNKIFNNGEPVALQLGRGTSDVMFDIATMTIFPTNKDDLIESLEKAKAECARNHKLSALKFYEDYLGIGLDSLTEPENINGCWWGPNRPFDYKITKEEKFGCTWQMLRYSMMPSTARDAGIPGFNK